MIFTFPDFKKNPGIYKNMESQNLQPLPVQSEQKEFSPKEIEKYLETLEKNPELQRKILEKELLKDFERLHQERLESELDKLMEFGHKQATEKLKKASEYLDEENRLEELQKLIDSKEIILADDLIKNAEQHIGSRYKYGGTNENGFDCSGLCKMASNGTIKERSSTYQYLAAQPRETKNVQPGDLMFWKRSNGTIFHVEIIISKNPDGTYRTIGSSTDKDINGNKGVGYRNRELTASREIRYMPQIVQSDFDPREQTKNTNTELASN